MRRIGLFGVCLGAGLAAAGAHAQDAPRIMGPVAEQASLESPAFGCFDPAAAAALRRGAEISDGLSELMVTGTCLAFEPGETLNDIERARFGRRNLLRARPNNAPAHVYFPDWAVGLGDDDGGGAYDARATAALIEAGPSPEELERRARRWMDCRSEADRLTSQILEFNAEVEAALHGDGAATGTRIPSATVVVPSMQFRNDSERGRELETRRHELSDARQELNERCAAILQDSYDVDYIAYLWHMAGI